MLLRIQRIGNFTRRFRSFSSDIEGEAINPYWTSMERRVVNRRTKPKGDGPSGRSDVSAHKTEEDHWLQAGVYDYQGAQLQLEKTPVKK
jgi:hypothetical protein